MTPRATTPAFVLLSLALHGLLLLLLAWGSREVAIDLRLPEQVELGVMDVDLGGEPAPEATRAAAPPEPKPAIEAPLEPPRPRPADDAFGHVVDAGAPADAGPVRDAAVVDASTEVAVRLDAGAQGTSGAVVGPDLGEAEYGDGLGRVWVAGGDGEGGFGGGRGRGVAGAVVALHADLARIRAGTLILEAGALLEIVPEWERLFAGSGIDPLRDLDRVFVATPSLSRGSLVVSGRPRGGEARARKAAARLARAKGTRAEFTRSHGFEVAPWYSRGPTERVLALMGGGQVTIARPVDLDRVLALGHALSRRYGGRRGMERARGAAALLSMMQGESVALSVEGVPSFVRGEVPAVPLGLRLSLGDLDELYSRLTAEAYYASDAEAAAAFDFIDAQRGRWAVHPRAQYLGIRSALEEATLSRDGKTLCLSGKLTMHQTRYLLQFVTRVLRPRD